MLKSEECNKKYVEKLRVRLTIEQAVKKLPEEIRETAVLYFFSGIEAKRNCRITSYQTFSCKISNRKSKRTFNERVGGEKR